jgi:hypothetical protein
MSHGNDARDAQMERMTPPRGNVTPDRRTSRSLPEMAGDGITHTSKWLVTDPLPRLLRQLTA